MDLIGLVKDSFEAVAQEVGAACQRTSCTAVSDDDARQRDNARTPGRAELQMPEGSTASTNATALANSAAPAHEDTSHDNGGVENRTTKNESVHAEVDSQSGTNVSDDDSNDESSELSVQPSEFPNQLRLLAEVMQTASQQLSAVATDESGEPDEDPQTIATAELQAEQVELRKLFESRIHSDEVQARALERLHSELQTSRKQLQRAEMAPLFKDIIFCHDFRDARTGTRRRRRGLERLAEVFRSPGADAGGRSLQVRRRTVSQRVRRIRPLDAAMRPLGKHDRRTTGQTDRHERTDRISH
jgi:hypothetical protein